MQDPANLEKVSVANAQPNVSRLSLVHRQSWKQDSASEKKDGPQVELTVSEVSHSTEKHSDTAPEGVSQLDHALPNAKAECIGRGHSDASLVHNALLSS